MGKRGLCLGCDAQVSRTILQGDEKVMGWLTCYRFWRSDKLIHHALPPLPVTIRQLAGRFACSYSQFFVTEIGGGTFSPARWRDNTKLLHKPPHISFSPLFHNLTIFNPINHDAGLIHPFPCRGDTK